MEWWKQTIYHVILLFAYHVFFTGWQVILWSWSNLMGLGIIIAVCLKLYSSYWEFDFKNVWKQCMLNIINTWPKPNQTADEWNWSHSGHHLSQEPNNQIMSLWHILYLVLHHLIKVKIMNFTWSTRFAT